MCIYIAQFGKCKQTYQPKRYRCGEFTAFGSVSENEGWRVAIKRNRLSLELTENNEFHRKIRVKRSAYAKGVEFTGFTSLGDEAAININGKPCVDSNGNTNEFTATLYYKGKVIQDYPEVGAILDAYQKGECHNLILSQEALQALADATGVNTEVLLTSITAQQGTQGATNKELTVIDTHDELRQDSIQTLAHELDHVRGGKNETLADLAGLAAKLNTEAVISANKDTINPIKAQLGDGTDTLTIAQNQALLNQNNQTFTENHEGKEGEWEYIIQGVDTQEYKDGSGKIVRTYYAERHNVYNWQARRIYDEYKKFFAQNNIDESQVSLELKKQLILDLMKEYGVSDSTFSAFAGSNFIISDDNNVVTDTLANQTSKTIKISL